MLTVTNGKGSWRRIGENVEQFRNNLDDVNFSKAVKCPRCDHEFNSNAVFPTCSRCKNRIYAQKHRPEMRRAFGFGRRVLSAQEVTQ